MSWLFVVLIIHINPPVQTKVGFVLPTTAARPAPRERDRLFHFFETGMLEFDGASDTGMPLANPKEAQ